jgi:hypothetical protein
MVSCKNVEFPYMGQKAWFENTRNDLKLKIKLSQVCIPSIHSRYMVRVLYRYYSCYSDTRGVTALPPKKKSQPEI